MDCWSFLIGASRFLHETFSSCWRILCSFYIFHFAPVLNIWSLSTLRGLAWWTRWWQACWTLAMVKPATSLLICLGLMAGPLATQCSNLQQESLKKFWFGVSMSCLIVGLFWICSQESFCLGSLGNRQLNAFWVDVFMALLCSQVGSLLVPQLATALVMQPIACQRLVKRHIPCAEMDPSSFRGSRNSKRWSVNWRPTQQTYHLPTFRFAFQCQTALLSSRTWWTIGWPLTCSKWRWLIFSRSTTPSTIPMALKEASLKPQKVPWQLSSSKVLKFIKHRIWKQDPILVWFPSGFSYFSFLEKSAIFNIYTYQHSMEAPEHQPLKPRSSALIPAWHWLSRRQRSWTSAMICKVQGISLSLQIPDLTMATMGNYLINNMWLIDWNNWFFFIVWLKQLGFKTHGP